ncbi:MAG: inositol monophosphatase family protein [Gemmatimonadota bacterium]
MEPWGEKEERSGPGRVRGATDAELLDAAVQAAERAAELHRREAGRLDPDGWHEKATADFVTEVDREAERLIVETLRERFPDHALLAEEGTWFEPRGDPSETRSAGSGAPPVRWIIDPLDGTTNWLHGYPEYAVSLAALDAGGLRAALVLNSATGERFDAVRGGGSRRDGRAIRVSELSDLRLALVGTGFPFKRRELLDTYLPMLGRVLRASSGVRRAGSAALDLCALASGHLDAFWELWLMPWDVAAGALIVREAGGTFEPLECGSGRDEAEPAAALGDAVRGAREFLAACAGGAPPGEPRAGAYLATNARLTEALRQTIAPG